MGKRLICLCIMLLLMIYHNSVLTEETLSEKEETTTLSYEIAAAEYQPSASKPRFDSSAENIDAAAWEKAFDAWYQADALRRNTAIPDRDAFDAFIRSSAESLLTAEDGQNKLYSPFSLWTALHLLSTVTANETRTQIARGLGLDSQDALDGQAKALWTSQYWNDGESSCVPGASLWLDESVELLAPAMEKMTALDHASVFQGGIADEGMTEALQAWLNRQTADLLSGPVSEIRLDPSLRAALFTTLYFRANWTDEFYEAMNEQRVFHAPSGGVEREFMKQKSTDTVYYGQQFSAYIKNLEVGSKVAFLLPNESTSPEAMMRNTETYRFLFTGAAERRQDWAIVTFAMPKLDCSVDASMREYLEAIGVTDVFDLETADFSAALISADSLWLSEVQQCARVRIDEQGVAAAAITRMMVAGAAMPPPLNIEFILDRPFAFAILGPQNVPLFLGVINMP